MNLDAILRISAKVTGTDAVQSLGKAIGGAEKAAQGAKGAFKNVVGSAAWQGAAVAAAAVGAALAYSTKQAIDFESSIADVRKVVDGIDTPQGLKEIRSEIIGLSKVMPIAAKGFADIYAAAGQAGIPRAEIRAFAVDVAKMAVAFDMTAAEAGDAMAKLRSALGLTQPQIKDLADALNYLSNGTASSGAELVEFTKRSGAVGQMAKLSAEQTAAFGAAMIGAGIEVEVAATSFNNMIKALSRGASMTARQESALKALGLATRTVADGEKEMTREVQRQADRRLEVMQDESDRQQAELRKRYRRQLQLLEDKWSDESDAFDEGIRDQTDAQVKALQRQTDAKIKALQQQFGDDQEAADRAATALRDQLDLEVDAIRDAADRKLKLQQRANRDQQQAVRDGLDERMETEIKGMQRISQQQQEEAKEGTANAIEAAKAAAGAGGSAAGQELAKRLQADALGTIKDVFARLKNLPDDQRISVLSDLFGDEARGLAPMVQNLGSLEKALSLVADKTKYAGSMAKEYDVRSQTTANALQLAKNNFDALSISVGATLIPALTSLVNFFSPVISGLASFAEANPAITTVIVSVTALAAAFILLAPGILAAISLLTPLVTGIMWVVAAIGQLGGIVSVIGMIGTALVAIVGWPLLIVAGIVAAVALIFTFREQIAGFFTWMADLFMKGLAQLGQIGYTLFVAPWVAMWGLVRAPVMGFFSWLSGTAAAAWAGITTVAYQLFVEPMVKLWDLLKIAATAYFSWWQQQWVGMSTFVGNVFTSISNTFNNLLVKPLTNAWKFIVNTAKGAIRGLLQWAANAINGVINIINNVIRGINRVRAALRMSTFSTIGKVSVPAFAQGGFVTGPTLAVMGDNAGGREYAVPEGKAVGFANNILAGRRGASAIPSSSSGGTGGGGAVTVNITTGPVMQDASGQQWMTVEDGQKMAGQIIRQLRTPAGRYATGVR